MNAQSPSSPTTNQAFTRAKDNPDADLYFSVDVETDGPIPGQFSMLSFAIVTAGVYDGSLFLRPPSYENNFYREISPISNNFEREALAVNGLDRNRILVEGSRPVDAMNEAAQWIADTAGRAQPVLVAYPLSFDWMWMYWYFVNFCASGSPFAHSRCFDLKTAYAVKAHVPIGKASRSKMAVELRSRRRHTHHALDDSIEQAEIFANLFEWDGLR